VHPYTKQTALRAGKIDGEQQRRGVTIPFVDPLIGAMALEVGYSLLTRQRSALPSDPESYRLAVLAEQAKIPANKSSCQTGLRVE
jgi:hypothetical protein